jgi:RNA polymerase sigma-70 factor (ECF subfamily)
MRSASTTDRCDRLYRAACVLCESRSDAERLVLATLVRSLGGRRARRREDDLALLLRSLAERGEPPPGGDRDPGEAQLEPVYAAVRTLSSPLREAVVAVDILGLSYKEAARALGTGAGALAGFVHRGRDAAAALLEETPGSAIARESERGPA